MGISILYSPNTPPEHFHPISEVTWHDLGMDLILPKVTTDLSEQNIIRYIMLRLNKEPDAVQYRLDVFDDLLHHPELCQEIQKLLKRIRELEERMSLRNALDKSESVWTLMSRLREIDEYIDCVETIGRSLEKAELKSEGLRTLFDYIQKIQTESFFADLRKDIKELRVMTSRVKSVTLGINLDENYETQTIGIVSLNDKPFAKSGLLANLTNRISSRDKVQSGNEWKNNYSYQPVDTDAAGASFLERTSVLFTAAASPLMMAGLGMASVRQKESARNTVGYIESVMNQMMSDSVRAMKEFLSKYVTVDIHSITDLLPEFLYYIRWAEYIRKLQEDGYIFCKAEAAAQLPDSASYRARGIYNMKLASLGSAKPQEIVANDLDFTPEQNCFILTGANRGGKTTITQAVGQTLLLAQGGIYIPGEGLVFRPVDAVYTHFPADEDKTMDYGRLGEECSRFREIYMGATQDSMILLNESFSTTSFEEGYYIAYDVVRALLRKGCRTLYNTHMHKLAREVAALNEETGAESRAVSLIVKNEGSRRSYRLEIAPPEGTSYAKDIAEKYGLTYEQLIQ